MAANPPRPKRQDAVVTSLNIAIDAMNLAKEASSVTPAKAVFGVVSILLTMIKVRLYPATENFWFTSVQDTVANKTDFVELGLACAEVCKALDRGMGGKKPNTLSRPLRDAIAQLTMWVKISYVQFG